MRRSAEHLSGLIDGLLDISKIEAGRFHLDRHEVRIASFSTSSSTCSACRRPRKGIEFHFFPPEQLPVAVYTDENRLRQILINLLSNAIKFTDAGHVTLRMTYRNQVAEFIVEDTGIGIHADDLEPHLPAVRARAHAARRATTGTGLGLTITKLLAETMGGEITVTSEAGKGSTFRVKLLLSEVSNPRTTSTMEDHVRGYAGPPQTILIVDDDHKQRDLVRELLEPLGFTVFDRQLRRRMPRARRAAQAESHLARRLDAGDGRLGGRRQLRAHSARPPGHRHAVGLRARSRSTRPSPTRSTTTT